MSTALKIGSILFVVALFGGVIFAETFSVQTEGVGHVAYTTNAEELTANRLVGQTFVSPAQNLSGIGVLFATYSGRTNTQPVELHVRASITDSNDLRVVTADPRDFGDNQTYRFTFEPIPDSAGQTFFFYVVSPGSSPGDAVTVDLDTRDPYHLGTAFLVRGPPELLNQPTALEFGGKQTIDVAFNTYHTVPVRTAVLSGAEEAAKTFVGTFSERRGEYGLWLKLFFPVLALVLLMWLLSRESVDSRLTKPRIIVALTILVIAGFIWRLYYAVDLPLTNDEGNYLYDAFALRQGVLAGGDGYVKAPLVIGWVALWQMLLGNTLMAGRVASMVVAVLTAVPLYAIGRSLANKRTGLMISALWLLAGAPAVFGIYVHTQALALLFGVSGIAVLWTTLQQDKPLTWRFVAAGVLLGLAVASRKSALALGLIPLVFILLESPSWRLRGQRLLYTGLGFAAVLFILLGYGGALYGSEGLREVIGLNSAEDGIVAVDPAEVDQVRAYSIRGVTPVFREAFTLIALALMGWGLVLEQTLRRIVGLFVVTKPTKQVLWLIDQALPKIVWVLPLLSLWSAWQFFFEYEGEIYHRFGGMTSVWYIALFLMLVVLLWPRRSREAIRFSETPIVPTSTQPVATSAGSSIQAGAHVNLHTEPISKLMAASLLLPLWFGGLYLFYTNWIKFHANYLVEFLVPAVILAGVGAVYVASRLTDITGWGDRLAWLGRWLRRVAVLLLSLWLIWGLYVNSYITRTVPHTGTFDQGAVQEAANWLSQNVPADQTLFTGAAAIPYVAGYRTALDIGHPRWYAYQSTRENTPRLNTFLPPIEEMLHAYRTANWLLLDKQTGFSFLMEYSEIEAGLETDWEKVHAIENGSNTLTFYRRTQPSIEL